MDGGREKADDGPATRPDASRRCRRRAASSGCRRGAVPSLEGRDRRGRAMTDMSISGGAAASGDAAGSPGGGPAETVVPGLGPHLAVGRLLCRDPVGRRRAVGGRLVYRWFVGRIAFPDGRRLLLDADVRGAWPLFVAMGLADWLRGRARRRARPNLRPRGRGRDRGHLLGLAPEWLIPRLSTDDGARFGFDGSFVGLADGDGPLLPRHRVGDRVGLGAQEHVPLDRRTNLPARSRLSSGPRATEILWRTVLCLSPACRS